jgi:hypothetical protein
VNANDIYFVNSLEAKMMIKRVVTRVGVFQVASHPFDVCLCRQESKKSGPEALSLVYGLNPQVF